MVIGMKVRATNTRLADMSKNTVQSQRRLRIDRHGRDRPCAEALEREVEDGHPTYKVPPTSLMVGRYCTRSIFLRHAPLARLNISEALDERLSVL